MVLNCLYMECDWWTTIQVVLANDKDTNASIGIKELGLRRKSKVVLAYNGGLDTSVIVPRLKMYVTLQVTVDIN